jgi:hypothetical protein
MSLPTDPVDPGSPEDQEEPEEPDTFARDTRGEELPAETPEADAAEQRTALRPDEDAPLDEGPDGEADDADRAEQARSAGGGDEGEDDYR